MASLHWRDAIKGGLSLRTGPADWLRMQAQAFSGRTSKLGFVREKAKAGEVDRWRGFKVSSALLPTHASEFETQRVVGVFMLRINDVRR